MRSMTLDRHLVDAFGAASPEHFRWKTEAPVAAGPAAALPFLARAFDRVRGEDAW
jgi:hypothetical protein